MSNINDTYFDGHYKQIWKSIIPDELTVKETDFMLQYFKLQPGSRVLDLMCGYGRHSLALAEKGIKVTAVDNLPDYINEVKNIAQAENLPVHPVLGDVMLYAPEENFDLVICMGNSLQFFHKQEVLQLLKKLQLT
jgi:2-polyprenyl-3-methyl-5-hydroxy-6-metoxy-1,4-benzoquinol methylase